VRSGFPSSGDGRRPIPELRRKSHSAYGTVWAEGKKLGIVSGSRFVCGKASIMTTQDQQVMRRYVRRNTLQPCSPMAYEVLKQETRHHRRWRMWKDLFA
jgi:hypothetical protein